jgi:hypothetical protein
MGGNNGVRDKFVVDHGLTVGLTKIYASSASFCQFWLVEQGCIAGSRLSASRSIFTAARAGGGDKGASIAII